MKNMTNNTINTIVEIPMGSLMKYEVEKSTGILYVDRLLPAKIPYNYGFVPNTLYKDGDPLDMIIINSEPIQPLCKVNVVLLGVFICDDNGQPDDKLIGIVKGAEHLYTKIETDLAILAAETYLSMYKPGFEVLGFEDISKAIEVYEWSVKNALEGQLNDAK